MKADTSEKLTFINIPLRNKLGLAAGLDKNGDYIDALASLGFGFLEIGTVTPRPNQVIINQDSLGSGLSKPLLITWVLITKELITWLIELRKENQTSLLE